MALQYKHRHGAKERDVARDYPQLGSEAPLDRLRVGAAGATLAGAHGGRGATPSRVATSVLGMWRAAAGYAMRAPRRFEFVFDEKDRANRPDAAFPQ